MTTPPKRPTVARGSHEERITGLVFMVEQLGNQLEAHKQEQKSQNDHLTRTIDAVDTGVREILLAMVGNEKFKQKGLVDTVEELTADVADLKGFKKQILVYASVAGLAVGVLWDMLKEKLNPFA